jgi:hypothetical protein
MTTKRQDRAAEVYAFLAKHPKGATLWEIVKGTKLSAPAVCKALADIRNEPEMGYATVATAGGGYRYMIARTFTDMKPGVANQARHFAARAKSISVMGVEGSKVAETVGDYEMAALLKVHGSLVEQSAQAILAALTSEKADA